MLERSIHVIAFSHTHQRFLMSHQRRREMARKQVIRVLFLFQLHQIIHQSFAHQAGFVLFQGAYKGECNRMAGFRRCRCVEMRILINDIHPVVIYFVPASIGGGGGVGEGCFELFNTVVEKIDFRGDGIDAFVHVLR